MPQIIPDEYPENTRMRFKASNKRFKAGINRASTFHPKQHRTPEKCLHVQNKAICAVSFRNAAQSMPETVRSISRNAGTDQAETISRRGSRTDCITLSRRSGYRAIRSTAPVQLRQNQPETIALNRSSLPRSARAGFFAALRSWNCAADTMLPYCHARKCFLRFFCADFSELHQMSICGNS